MNPRHDPAAFHPVRIAFDMDEVLADTLAKWVAVYNADLGGDLTTAALRGTKIYRAVPPEHRTAVRAYPDRPGFFRDLDVLPGAVEILQALAAVHEVYIASSAMEHPTSLPDKYEWVRERFPFIPPERLIFCGDKSILSVDYLVDDHSRHFARLRGQGVLFTAPHNVNDGYPVRVTGWPEVQARFLPRQA